MSLNLRHADELLHASSMDLLTDRKSPLKERSHSESPQRGANINLTCDPSDVHTLSTADIYSWKLKKGTDGVIFAVYCIHVSLKSGVKWLVEKRYTQFRELRKEIKKVWPDLAQLEFPKKRWMFNLSRGALKERQAVLNAYLGQLMEIRPQPLEVAIFLEIEINIGGMQLSGTTLSQRRAASGVDSMEALLALRRRTLSFPPGGGGVAGLGEVGGAVGLSDFHLIKVLGKGSFGKVFLVRPLAAQHDQVFAMKVLRKVDVIKRHQVEHTLTERSILANTPHPFILALRYAFQNEHKLYMVTDYCPGGELFFHLKKLRRFTEGMMRFYSAEIALALSHLHQHSIVYRDLKPENVLLDKNGHIKLTDFGLSKRVTSFALGTMEASTATFCGTPEYLSPEMIVHRRSGTGYSKEVDWWALGIVCFELLTGWPPFYDRDFTKMCEKILYKPLIFPVKKYNITKDAEDVIKGLLQRDFTRRMTFEPLPLPLPSSSNSNSNNKSPSVAGGKSKSSSAKSSNLRTHPFYADMDWAALVKKQVVPPFVPPMGRDITDTRNFEKEFTKLTVKDSPPASVSETAAALSVMNKDTANTSSTKDKNSGTPGSTGGVAGSSKKATISTKVKKGSDASGGTGGSSTLEATIGAGDDEEEAREPDVFTGFSYNGHSALGQASSSSVNNSSILSAPPSPSPVKRNASSASTPLLLPAGGSPTRSSRDKSTDKSLLPQLGLRSSNGHLSTVRASLEKM